MLVQRWRVCTEHLANRLSNVATNHADSSGVGANRRWNVELFQFGDTALDLRDTLVDFFGSLENPRFNRSRLRCLLRHKQSGLTFAMSRGAHDRHGADGSIAGLDGIIHGRH